MKPGAARDGVAEASRSPRPLLQYETPAFDDRLREPYGVREAGWISLGGCQPDRVEAKVRMDALIKWLAALPDGDEWSSVGTFKPMHLKGDPPTAGIDVGKK